MAEVDSVTITDAVLCMLIKLQDVSAAPMQGPVNGVTSLERFRLHSDVSIHAALIDNV